MDITKYSKKSWIITLIFAIASIIFDILILTGVVGGEDGTLNSTARLGLAIGAIGIFYSVKGIAYHVKKEKEEN